MNEDSTQSAPITETPTLTPEPTQTPTESIEQIPIETETAQLTQSSESTQTTQSPQPITSEPTAIPSEAPESPTDTLPPTPAQDQNQGVNTTESDASEPAIDAVNTVSADTISSQPAPVTQATPVTQLQSPVQFDQVGFIHGLLIKAQAKIQFNKQKKLEKIIQFASTREKITNDEVQNLLRVSDKTAERYLKKLVAEGKLQRFGATKDISYGITR